MAARALKVVAKIGSASLAPEIAAAGHRLANGGGKSAPDQLQPIDPLEAKCGTFNGR